MPTDEGAWQCGDGHMFRYEPPPASPPWCVVLGCKAGDFRWILKDEVTGRDWLPDDDGTRALHATACPGCGCEPEVVNYFRRGKTMMAPRVGYRCTCGAVVIDGIVHFR